MSKTNTQILSEFLSSVKYEDIPQSALDQAKKMTLHTVGAAIASRGLDASRKPIELALEVGGREEATIWGSGSAKVSAQEAAFANGTLSDLLDWEDCSWTGHPSASIVPVAFAVAEAEHKSGKDYITAIVAAYVEGLVADGLHAGRNGQLGQRVVLERHRGDGFHALGNGQVLDRVFAEGAALNRLDACRNLDCSEFLVVEQVFRNDGKASG